MSDREGLPLNLLNTTLGPKEVEFRQHQAGAKFGRGPKLPGAEDFLRACAMVDTALNLNITIRHLWLDITCAWDKPGCAAYASWGQTNSDLAAYVDRYLSSTEADWSFIARAYNEWQVKFRNNPDVTHLNGLMDAFIVKAFNGPIKPVLRRILGAIEYKKKPKYKVKVSPDKTRPELKQSIAFLSWCDHKGVDLREIDRARMSADYEVVTSGQKPSTTYGRKRKPQINRGVRNIGLSFISDKAVYGGAEKWYTARVIRGSVTEAASEYGIANPSTFENEIKGFDHIAGLR